MRKDSELFLKKTLEYKRKIGKDTFTLNINYFSDIPNIEIETEVKSNPNIIFNVSGGQINVANDNGKIEAKQYRSNEQNKTKVIVIEDSKSRNQTIKTDSATSSNSGYEMSILAGFILLILTKIYLNYRSQVQLGLVITSILIEMITIIVYYNGKKKGIIYGENIKEISYFNMISILVVPVLIGIINSPMYTSKVSFDILIQEIENQNLIIALLNSGSIYYAIFQMAGMIFLALFMIYIICSDIYIIAIINIVSDKKGQGLWNCLLKLTHGGNKNWKTRVKVGLLFMIISILFASGIFPYMINRLNVGNLSILKS